MNAIRHRVTLVDTIAVMCICIVLYTMLLPLILKVSSYGKDIRCRGNLKSLAASVMAYAVDWKGRAPCGNSGNNNVNLWLYRLQEGEYITAVKVGLSNGSTGNSTIISKSTYMSLAGLTYNFAYYPISYKNILTCPAENINEISNSWLCTQFSYSMSNFQNARWRNGTHYGMYSPITDGSVMTKYKPYRVMVGDNLNGYIGFYNNNDRMYWGRHGGRSINVNSTTTGSTYYYLGPARINTIVIDGHLEPLTDSQVFSRKIFEKY